MPAKRKRSASAAAPAKKRTPRPAPHRKRRSSAAAAAAAAPRDDPAELPDISREPEAEARTLSVLKAQYVNAFTRPGGAMRSAANLQGKARGWLQRARESLQARGPEMKAEGVHRSKLMPGQRKKRTPVQARARALLLQRLDNLGLDLCPCEDDGNCQFRAISASLQKTQDHHVRLRQLAVQWMREHREDFEPFLLPEDGSWEEFLDNIARPGEWGGHKTITALCNALGVVIHVLCDDPSGEWVYSVHKPHVEHRRQPERHAFLAYEQPVHYDCIVARDPAEGGAAAAPSGSPAKRPRRRR